MFNPNYVIIVLSPEISLKSSIVQEKINSILKENVINLLREKNISFSSFYQKSGRMFLQTNKCDEVINTLKNCFGIYKLVKARKEKFESIDEISKTSLDLCNDFKGSFAIRCKSVFNKIKSKDVEIKVGADVVDEKNLKVNLTKPDNQLNILILSQSVFFYFDEISGAKGMPVGSQGRVVLFGDNKELIFNLNKFGCVVLKIGKDMSLEKAKEQFYKNKINAFFCDAKTISEKKQFDKLVGVKVFAPLIFG